MQAAVKVRSLKGIVWSAGESFGVALLSFLTFAIMARLLEPRDFGIAALAGVFLFFSNLVVTHGFSDVLVQRRQIEPAHLDTAFWSTLAVATLLMAACMAAAGVIAGLFGEPALADVLRVLALAMPLGAIASVPLAVHRREMRFRAVALRSLVGRLAGAVAGIAMAAYGFGVWSLVAQQLVGTLVVALSAFAGTQWYPRLRFSRRRLGEMWVFGANVSATQIIGGASEQALNVMVGALFGSVALGYFNIAWRMVQLVRSLVSSAVYHVGLGAFSRLQDDREAVGRAFIQATRIACLAGLPLAVGISLVAEPLLLSLFGHKWGPSVPLLAILALELVATFYAIFFSALFRATDRAGWTLVMAVLSLTLGIGGVLALAPLGTTAVAAFWVARWLLLMPVQVVMAARILAVPVNRIAAPVVVPALATLVMAAGLVPLRLWLDSVHASGWTELAVLVPAGVALYGIAVRLFSPDLAGLALRTVRVIAMPVRDASGT